MHKRNYTKTQYRQHETQKIQVHILPKTPTHTLTHPLQSQLKQPQYKTHPNEIVTIQSNTLSIRSP